MADNKKYVFDSVDTVYNILDTLQDETTFKVTNKDDWTADGYLNVGYFLPIGRVTKGRDGLKRDRLQMWVSETGTVDFYIGTALLNNLNLANIRRLAKLQKKDARLWESVEVKVQFRSLTDALYTLNEILSNIQRVQARTGAVIPKADNAQATA